MKTLIIISGLLLLTACSQNTLDAAITVEDVLDISKEKVSFILEDEAAYHSLSDWMSKDKPVSADVICDARCPSITRLLASHQVPYSTKMGDDNEVVLYYSRIVARECNAAYQDNGRNLSNKPVQSMGCANAMNTIQMVSNRSEFVEPAMMTTVDAEMMSPVVEHYKLPIK